MRIRSASLLVVLLLSAAACGGAGVAAVRVQLNADLSGTVVTSCLAIAETAGPLEPRCNGVEWGERANLFCARGRFTSIAELRVADVTYAAGTTPAGFSYVQVTVPRGAEAQWPAAMSPPGEARGRALRAFDPDGAVRDAANNVMFELEVPGEVLGNQVTPSPRGTSVEHSRRRCTMVVPIDRATQGGEPLVWLVTWK